MSDAPTNLADTAADRLDRAIRWGLLGLLAFMPLAFGAVEAWSELVVVAIATGMLLCLGIKLLIDRDGAVVRTWAYLPLVLFLMLAAMQLLPLPAGWVGRLSPQTLAIRSRLLSDLPGSEQILSAMTLSFDPPATRQVLRIALSAAAVFVVVIHVCRRPEQVLHLLSGIALIGVLVALLALAQILSGAQAIYWQVPLSGLANAGPFVNHNNFAQFMNLSIGAMLALLLVHVSRSNLRGRSLPGLLREMDDGPRRLVKALAAAIMLGAAAIFLSMSRGGMIAFLIALLITGLALARRSGLHSRGWLLVLLGLGAFSLLLYLGFDAVYHRLATLSDLEQASGGRWQINRDVWQRIRPDFGLWGIGLGAHALVYPMFSRLPDAYAAGHVENEYLQLIEESGFVGLGLVGLFVSLIAAQYLRGIRRESRSIHAAAYGLGFGLVAVMVHSFSDFGQRLAANACLSAAGCGLLVSLGRIGRPHHAAAPAHPSRLRVPAAVLLLGLSLGCGGWALAGAVRAALAEHHWTRALAEEKYLARQDWQGQDEDYALLILHAQAAAEAEPDNILYQHWLNVYRWYAISRQIDPETNQIILSQDAVGHAARIALELNRARALGPTYGPTYCVAGQIELFILDRPIGARHIRTGYELAPNDPTVCFVAGRLDAAEGRFEESLLKLGRSVELGQSMRDVLGIYLYETRRADLALKLAANDAGALRLLAELLDRMQAEPAIAAEARQRAMDLLASQAAADDAPPRVLASLAGMHFQQGQYETAIEYYRRALKLNCGQVHWRYELAQALARTGQTEQAIEEARVCAKLRPDLSAATRLIAELSVPRRAVLAP